MNKMLFGICADNLSETSLLKEIGYDYIEMTVPGALQPAKSDAEWEPVKNELLASPLPVYACNCFIPGSFRLTGPNADFAPALDFAETACRRADEIGCRYIVLGSGGARNVPCTFGPGGSVPFQIEAGRDQFAEFCSLLAKRIEGRKVTVVIEPLRPSESNIIQYVWQGMQIVDEINSPRIAVLADIFHMMMGREEADSILKAGGKLKHCHIASNKTRLYPGRADSDQFVPYFRALREAGYSGGMTCECGWDSEGDSLSRREKLEKALSVLKSLENA